ncbi:HAD hydrolase [Cytidiella melzeri]|nr:HAD hydrolase [Cytidiella melzeri]
MLHARYVFGIERKVVTRPACSSSVLRGIRCIQRDAAKRLTQQSPLAFVFDIDGVLIRGTEVLPEAKRALRMLDGANQLGLTNGGGVSEEERCRKLSQMLDHPIGPSHYVQAHTILKSVTHKYADEPVLVLGGRQDILEVAKGYGFKHTYTTLDIKAWNPAVWPFRSLTDSEMSVTQKVEFSNIQFRAILVFHDPRDWALDTQVALDVIRSGGVVGGPYLSPSSNPKVDLIFCNPDLLWRNEFPRSRLGQGAFKEAFQAVYKVIFRSTYPYLQFGKPTAATYKFAEQVLRDRISEVQGTPVANMPQIYMVGDNPASDIAGANAAGWNSVLVRTGVYDPADGPPAHEPTFEVANVEEAVTTAVARAALTIS